VVASRSSSVATAGATRSSSHLPPALDPERRSQLLVVKLSVLAREHLDLVDGEPTTFPGGAALRAGARGAVLVEDQPERGLGRALSWASRNGIEELHVLVEDRAGQLARQAAAFATPPTVWWVQARDLHPVEPEAIGAPVAASPAALALAPEIEAAGATLVVEHGGVTGEVLGLEVARVVEHDLGVSLEVGIGRHDREAFAIIHGDRPAAEALAGVVAAVRGTRRPDAPEQPLHRLAQERWLREVLLARPDLVGAAHLERHEGPLPRPNVKDPWPAVAVGDGAVAVCSAGVDLDLVPFAADARLAADPGARLVLVVPERDAHAVTVDLAAALADPAEVVTVPPTWRELVR
jgi:hypothetical protein